MKHRNKGSGTTRKPKTSPHSREQPAYSEEIRHALHVQQHDIDAAAIKLNRAITLQPGNAEANAKMAYLHNIRGEPGKSTAYYRKAIELDPHYSEAHQGLVFLQRQIEYTDDIRRMETTYASPDISDFDRMLVGFSLGKVFDDLKQYDKAFEFFHEANQIHRKTYTYSVERQRVFFDQHKEGFNQEFFNRCKDYAVTDNTPIFILGMPRSGTSLVEQILASHPLVHGAGEVEYIRLVVNEIEKLTGKPFPQNIDKVAPEKLRDISLAYIENLKANAGEVKRVTDKLPHNFLRIGLFAGVMPDAKIIHCDRNPMDVCLSIYQHYFSADHGYASDLKELGEYYNLYEDMMTFWHEQLPGHIYRISYEQLVSDTDNQIRQLLEYCELPFHHDCLAFHKIERVVKTPSASQVREPIYNNAVARWKNYAKYLHPLRQALAEK